MWPRLNIWIMAPGDAARIDDRDGWVVFTADAHVQAFQWKGFDYTTGTATAAPGWVEYEVPPGTYVVWAERTDGTMRTHKAVVAVHDEPVVTVRLLPDHLPEPSETPKKPPSKPDDRRQPDCGLTVDDLVGYMRGRDMPGRLELSGGATGCTEVRIVIRRTQGGGKVKGTATVGSDGSWHFRFENEADLRCGETVVVEVTCVRDGDCRERVEMTIRCTEDER